MLGAMAFETIMAHLDAEIARLYQVRNLLASTGKVDGKIGPTNGTAGRKTRGSQKVKAGAKRVLSAEARKAIADAQRRRWAAQKARSKKEA